MSGEGRPGSRKGDKKKTGTRAAKPGDILIQDLRTKFRKFRSDAKGSLKKIERSVLRKPKEKAEVYEKLEREVLSGVVGKQLQRKQHSEAAAIHGNFATILPVLDEQPDQPVSAPVITENEQVGQNNDVQNASKSNHLEATRKLSSEVSDLPEYEAVEAAERSPTKRLRSLVHEGNERLRKLMHLGDDSSRSADDRLGSEEYPKLHLPSPGELRLEVLEWLYDDRNVECPALTVDNFALFEDLVPVFVNVILHGNNKLVRKTIWAFLLNCASESSHFAFLIVCHLNSMQEENQGALDTVASQQRDKDRNASKDDGKTTKAHANDAIEENFPENNLDNDVEKLELAAHYLQEFQSRTQNRSDIATAELESALNLVQQVHDTQLFNKLHTGPTRSNISMLVEKVRKGLQKRGREELLSDLDGKLTFIQSLTNLDEWLMESCPKDERQQAAVRHLAGLNQPALEFGAYFPTATEKVGTGHRLLRLLVEETVVFNTAQKCPFLLVAEVQCSEDKLHVGEKHSLETGIQVLETAALGVTQHGQPTAVDSQIPPMTRGSPDQSIAEKRDVHASDELSRGRRLSSLDLVLSDCPKAKEAAPKGNRHDETWEDLTARIKKNSKFSSLPGWGISAMFVKAGDDLRQQQLGLLLVSTFQKIFLEEGVPVWLSPYKVISTSASTGLLEPARNADSIARIKERGGFKSLDEYFVKQFGVRSSKTFKKAQLNFLNSLAGYSIVSYLIKLHDRHNGNILIDKQGHMLHIDFGFMLGHYHKLERSPFKLTKEMVAVLGGYRSATFQKFRRLMEQAYIAASKHEREIVLLVDLMSIGSQSPCFAGGRRWVVDDLRGRLNPGLSKRQLRIHINDMIDWSLGNLSTRCYDKYQRCVNGIW